MVATSFLGEPGLVKVDLAFAVEQVARYVAEIFCVYSRSDWLPLIGVARKQFTFLGN